MSDILHIKRVQSPRRRPPVSQRVWAADTARGTKNSRKAQCGYIKKKESWTNVFTLTQLGYDLK